MMSLSVSLPRLVVKLVDQACARRTAQHFNQIDREISPRQRIFLDRGRSCTPWSRFACSVVVAIDNRTNPGKTSPRLLQAQGLVSVGPPLANGRSQQPKKETLQFAFLPKGQFGETFCPFHSSHRFQSLAAASSTLAFTKTLTCLSGRSWSL